MAEVGRPSELDEELRVKIKEGVLDGKTQQEIALDIGVAYDTFKGWIKRNYDGFADDMLSYKHEKLLIKAERNIDTFLDIQPDEDNPKMAQVVANVTMFTAETLGRKVFHKKSELDATGQFTTFEIVRGDAETKEASRPVQKTDSSVAQEDNSPVGENSIQDNSGRA